MTIEEWCGLSADELDKFTTEQLHEHFKQYFPVTRPELAQKVSTTSGPPRERQLQMPILSDKQKLVMSMLAAEGITIDPRKIKK
jgi:hypothetical protein